MFTPKIFISLLLVYLTRCEDACFQKYTCEWEKGQRNNDILIIPTETDELCAKKCCATKDCIGFDWVITAKRCYMTKTPRTVVPLVNMKNVWSCELKGAVRAQEARSRGSTPKYTLQLKNTYSKPACIVWKDYRGNDKVIGGCSKINPGSSCYMTTYGTHPFIARDCESRQLLDFTDGKRTDVIAEGLAFGATSGKKIVLKIIGNVAFKESPPMKENFGGICHRDFKKLGCFRRDWKLLTDLLITDLDPTHPNYTIPMNWDNFELGLHSLACRCREKAKGHYKYFAMGFHGECVTGKNNAAIEKMMAQDKDSAHGCINGEFSKCAKDHKAECAGVADYDFMYEITNH